MNVHNYAKTKSSCTYNESTKNERMMNIMDSTTKEGETATKTKKKPYTHWTSFTQWPVQINHYNYMIINASCQPCPPSSTIIWFVSTVLRGPAALCWVYHPCSWGRTTCPWACVRGRHSQNGTTLWSNCHYHNRSSRRRTRAHTDNTWAHQGQWVHPREISPLLCCRVHLCPSLTSSSSFSSVFHLHPKIKNTEGFEHICIAASLEEDAYQFIIHLYRPEELKQCNVAAKLSPFSPPLWQGSQHEFSAGAGVWFCSGQTCHHVWRICYLIFCAKQHWRLVTRVVCDPPPS